MNEFTADYIRGIAADAREKILAETNISYFMDMIERDAKKGDYLSAFHENKITYWQEQKLRKLVFINRIAQDEYIVYWGESFNERN